MKNFIVKAYAAAAAFAKKNPAVVSYVLTAVAAALAHYGFHVTGAQLAGGAGVVITLLHLWLHTQTRKA